jgi:23S rRNA (adenine2503-C2)-methyltransferase
MDLSRTNIYDLDLPQLEAFLSETHTPPYRARQIWHGLYRNCWQAAGEFTNLPSDFRRLLDGAILFQPLSVEKTLSSSDGQTEKTLFRLADGRAIETVLMAYEERRTLCISTQAGCAMGCVFCATGQMGFRRHLTSGEIVAQVMYYARRLKDRGEKVTNVVVMGMGEPFHNYEATMAAVDRLNHKDGFNFGARRFTISTVGLVPMIERFTREKRQINLAISLHAASDELRSSMLPINRKYPLDVLLKACKAYVEATGRRITFEWALIRDVNDSVETARALAGRLSGLLCHVNVIPLNPTQKYPRQATTRERAEAFRTVLERAGIPCTVRIRRGIDIQAGCGQLAETSHQPL